MLAAMLSDSPEPVPERTPAARGPWLPIGAALAADRARALREALHGLRARPSQG